MSNSNSEISLSTEDNHAIKNEYKTWYKHDGGKDGLTSMERLQQFMLMNGGENLNMYLGGDKEGRTFKSSKITILNKCNQYFQEQGVYRTTAQIKSKLNNLLTKQYGEVYRVWKNSIKNNSNDEGSTSEKEGLESELNQICPAFFQMEKVMSNRKTGSPAVCDTTKPMEWIHDEDGEQSNGDDDNTDEESAENSHSSNNEEYDSQNDNMSVLCSPPPKSSSSRKRRRVDVEYKELAEEVTRQLNESSVSLEAKIERLYREKLEVLKDDLHIKRECEFIHRKFENMMKTVAELAKVQNWSDEKVQEQTDDVYNKTYGS
ncbi:hypothetical protein PHYBLDRAFT_142444 [Phycomyces blakesleeanus NRRL 1555(-)]|uniref:Uncharacterized protein n=1 Tax=Phycomyces blakesleeanus (strain ATCC 8743b / DSM 1359 / FGSC 10004 / NBRC 33097 / NRRL 1555) TaxID=763407 RepID=A0A167NZB4_PHYB8|nr:hypothetical protein PHYBLDRAFT_142444 [Phycomyces blakesleeanus NRRL 1555(-)]OAD76936.1 hypothetical protein PHYBLDRAFT_142444 [Phycomyces blakesleeanus NRRL 1555(-)]|eukprot:XP_018294976.1 hypothetical protein PHYBLDRAFT_142444 [Phycomyces blakesleeanus NRRL 1555(-)]